MRRTNDFVIAYVCIQLPGMQSPSQKPDADFLWGRLEQLQAHLPYELSPGLPRSLALNFIIILVPQKQQKCVIFFADTEVKGNGKLWQLLKIREVSRY